MDWKFLIGPLMGLLIGAITNGVAIKMLFRPLHPVYIGKFRVPLTPGVIPKERERLAKAVGSIVSSQLLNTEVLSSALASPELTQKVENLADLFFDRFGQSEKTIAEEFSLLLGEDTAKALSSRAVKELCGLISQRLQQFSMGQQIIEEILNKHYEEKTPNAFMRKMLDSKMRQSLTASAGAKLDQLVSANAEQVVEKLVSDQAEGLLSSETGAFVSRYEEHRPELRRLLKESYLRLLQDELPRLLEAANIAGIVEERILSFDVAELETMVRSVANKELNAIIWFGALLGFLMGFVTSFF